MIKKYIAFYKIIAYLQKKVYNQKNCFSEELMSTVAAIGTPHGKGGVSMIRITGEDAFNVAGRVFRTANGMPFESHTPEHTCYGIFYDRNGEFDDGISVLYKGPRSFTGEDTAELFCHGGLLVTARLLRAVFAAGALPAQAGEFTKRAFVNGKLSLTRAEAIGGIIDAVSNRHLDISSKQAMGSLSVKIDEIIQSLVSVSASVYAFIDYPDEDMTDMTPDEMRMRLLAIKASVDSLTATHSYGRAVSEGLRVSIVGKPNTGKSSLLNMLCREQRAIVTDTAGTTRDVITERVEFYGMLLLLSDTAGIRRGESEIERLGIEKSYEYMKKSDIILAVFDGSSELDDEDNEIISAICKNGLADRTVCIMNKSDLGAVSASPLERCVVMSAKEGVGVEALAGEITAIIGASDVNSSDEIITNARQYAELCKASEAIGDAIRALDGYTQDIAGMDIERALGYLGEADGRSVSEDIVNEIFSHFCVGK